MKSGMQLTLFLIFTVTAATSGEVAGPITQVVKLLKGMVEKSRQEGDEERKIFSKFKCYCDSSEAEKTSSINELEKQIALLEAKIGETLGDNGELSSDVGELDQSIADNKASQKAMTNIRDKENKAFKAENSDLEESIGEMSNAIEMLSDVGADQTAKSGADHKQFMAGKSSLVSLKSAFGAASARMTPKQRNIAASFLQAPFTGTYTSQSAVVVGIFKSMRDTFRADLAQAIDRENFALDAYNKFIQAKTAAFDEMRASYNGKQKELGENDGVISAKRSQLSQANKNKQSEEEFLAKLRPLCAEKTKDYQERKLLRANEEAAIAETITILGNDAAFATFGGVDATSKGSTGKLFLQLSAVRHHLDANEMGRLEAKRALQQGVKSVRLSKVLSSLKAANPFETVVAEIEKMVDVIAEEGKADKKKLDWCNRERKQNNRSLRQKKKQILGLDQQINGLIITISDPEQGLEKQIAETENTLEMNTASQTEQTTNRRAENFAYQKDVKNLVDAASILTRGIKALKTYYDDLEKKLLAAAEAAMLQEDPKAPEAWKGDGAYAGQKKAGHDAIGMLEFIKSQTVKEEMEAHEAEEKSTADYEDSMAKLKKEEAQNEQTLTDLQNTLAEKQAELLSAEEDLKDTAADKDSINAYLSQIKAGCDFITSNFDQREKNRKTEKASLDKATRAIKATPAFKAAQSQARLEGFGRCKDKCIDDSETVVCKACLADVTVPAFCAGHKGTDGC